MSDERAEELDERVLLLAPTARDAVVSRDILHAAGARCFICRTIEDVCREAERGAGVAVVTAETILGDKERRLTDWLSRQPPWSDFPLVVLTPPGVESTSVLQALHAVGPMTLMKRPVQVSTLVSTVIAALRDRRRQYAVRDLLAERERAEQAQALLAAIVESSQDAIISKTLDGTIYSWNAGAERLFGYAPHEAVGRPSSLIIPPEREHEEAEILARIRRGEQVEHFETVRVSREGRRIDISLTVSPLRDDAGDIIGVSKIARDITDRKQAEAALREADRRKDEYMALLAHELRNPLVPLRNGLQVMRLAEGRPNAVAQARAMMERQLAHMVRLIDDLLDISRIRLNKMELRRSRVLLTDVVASAVEAARPLIEAAGLQLTVSLPPESVFLDADLTRLAQVFNNLLTNSAKYTERGGRIWLSAESQSAVVNVSVKDTGIGIPTDAQPGIFDMFSQVDRSIERSTGGLGIGLALVKGLVEMHGGTVTVKSGGQDSGSTFTISLPVLESHPERLADSTTDNDQAARGPRRRILVVDDSRDAATSMAIMLKLLGNEVRTAHDGLEAVEAAEQFRPEFVLMDVGMPRLNGLDATRRIREQPWGKAMTIIALTGWGQEGDRNLSKKAGCDGHLVKPVNLPDLENVLARVEASR